MTPTALLPFLLLLCTRTVTAQDTLFTIQDQGKTGYIDARGQVVIPPIYYAGYDFSEGLAAVRENGLYGFINTKGQYIIPPTFDKAWAFQQGITLVIKAGQPFLIDRTGQSLFPPVFQSIQCISTTKAIVETKDRKSGLLDIPTRRLIIDTVYWRLNAFEGGVLIAEKYDYDSKKYTQPRATVFDTLGRIIVPIDRYEEIKPFAGGLAVVSIKGRRRYDNYDEGLIDTRGNLLFRRPAAAPGYMWTEFHEGFARVLMRDDASYEAYINRQGKLVFDDTTYHWLTDFSRGRAFIGTDNRKYYLIDTTFTIISKEPFDAVEGAPFTNSPYVIVKSGDNWGIIDTSGRFVIPPLFPFIHALMGNYFAYTLQNASEEGTYGIMRLDKQPLINTAIQQYDPVGFVNGLLKTIIRNKLTYLDQQGKTIWQEAPDTSRFLRKLNIDYMARAYFRAYSTLGPDGQHNSGGWATSNNFPRKIRPTVPIPANRLSLVMDTARIDTFATIYQGYPLYLTNTTADTFLFRGQDSWLCMKVQAQNEKGAWVDIEYIPETFCGNSYHWLPLEPGAHWKFVVPVYEGAFNTLLRVELKYPDPADRRHKEKVLYTQPFPGSINPAQFNVKLPYHPRNIMDPYID